MTNQNDTQDEAERLAHEEAVRVSKLQGGKTQDGSNQCPECYLKGHTEGYRAGVASLACKHPGCACVCGHQGNCPEDGPIATGGTYE